MCVASQAHVGLVTLSLSVSVSVSFMHETLKSLSLAFLFRFLDFIAIFVSMMIE
jgi:hypothetical protein